MTSASTTGTTTRTVSVGTSQVLLQRVLSEPETARATWEVLHPTQELRRACWHEGT